MSDLCQIPMRRIATLDGQPQDGHPINSRCGRPVERDGLCRFHARQRDLDRAEERLLWRAKLRLVGR